MVDTRKKILIISEYFYPEEFKINELAIKWNRLGYKVGVITQIPSYPLSELYKGYSNKWLSTENYKGINVFRVKTILGYKNSILRKIGKYISFMVLGTILGIKLGSKYDYVFGFNVGPLTGMFPAVLINKVWKKDVTIWIQDVWPDSVYAYGFKRIKIFEYLLNNFVRFIYSGVKSIAISGTSFLDSVKLYSDSSKEIAYVPNWADSLNRDLKPFNFSNEVKTQFTFAGNIGKVQNLENIIEAFGSLDAKMSSTIQLNIIGDGSNRSKLESMVSSSKYRNIVFWGSRPRESMYKYFLSSDFLIVSLVSKDIFSATVPAKVLTYIAAEKPILAVILGDTANLVSSHNLGFCSNPDDIGGIRDTVIKCANSNAATRKIFSQNSATLTNTVFDREVIISRLLQLTVEN